MLAEALPLLRRLCRGERVGRAAEQYDGWIASGEPQQRRFARRGPQRDTLVVAARVVLEARRAPSANAASLAHTILGTCRCSPAPCAKPQSLLAITFSRPTRPANRRRRCAINSGCSTWLIAWLITPGIRILPSGNFTSCHTVHSHSWRGLAASMEKA